MANIFSSDNTSEQIRNHISKSDEKQSRSNETTPELETTSELTTSSDSNDLLRRLNQTQMFFFIKVSML